MAVTTTTYRDALKIDYHDAMVDQLERSGPLTDRVERRQTDHGGLHGYVALWKGRNEGITHAAENGNLASAGAQALTKATFKTKNTFVKIEVTGEAMSASRSDDYAFAEALQVELEGAVDDACKEMNQLYWGYGDAIRARIKASTGTGPGFYVDSARWLRTNMRVEILNTSDGTTPTGNVMRTISDLSGTLVTLGATITSSTAYGVYRLGSRSSGFVGTPYGLSAIISTGNPPNGAAKFGDIDRTTAGNEFWKSANSLNTNLTASANRDVSLDLLQETFDTVDIAAGKWPTAGYTNHAIGRQIANLTLGDRRGKFGAFETIEGGWRAVMFNNVPIIVDPDAISNTLFLIREEHLLLLIQGPWTWVDEDGGLLARMPSSTSGGYGGYKDSFEAILRRRHNLVANRCNSHVGLYQLNES